MTDELAELSALMATIPKHDAEADLRAAVEALDPDAQKTKLQKAVQASSRQLAELEIKLTAAYAEIDQLNIQLAAANIALAEESTKMPPPRPVPLPRPAAEIAELKQAREAKNVAQARSAELQVRLEVAEKRAADAEAQIAHEVMHAAAAESTAKDALARAEKAFDEGRLSALNEVEGGKLIAEMDRLEAKHREIRQAEGGA